MVRIVGIQKSSKVKDEFVLLQNQGNMKVNLRGHAVVADISLNDPLFRDAVYVVDESVELMPGQYALVRTSAGRNRWGQTADGGRVFSVFMGRDQVVWSECPGPFMLLAPQHVYAERALEPLMV